MTINTENVFKFKEMSKSVLWILLNKSLQNTRFRLREFNLLKSKRRRKHKRKMMERIKNDLVIIAHN